MSQFVEKLKVNFEFRNSLNISTATLFTVSYSLTHAAGLHAVHKMTDAWMTADLQRNADEICALLGYCGPYSGNFLCRHFGTSYLFRILEP